MPGNGPAWFGPGAALAQSSRELKDPQDELRDLHALRAVLVLGSARAGGSCCSAVVCRSWRAMLAHLMAVVSSWSRTWRQGAGGRRRRWASSSCPRQRLLQPRISINAREHPGRSRHEAQKTPSQTPDHSSRRACHVPAGTRSPRPQPKDPRLFTPIRAGPAAVRVTSSAIASAPASMPRLISSLIRLRPETFGLHHLRLTAQAADPPDLRRTQPRRLRKRVGATPCEFESRILRRAELPELPYDKPCPYLTFPWPSGPTAGPGPASVGFASKDQSQRPICRRRPIRQSHNRASADS